ncbi:unnamed protein product [Haemonchus placei]|uniref:Uncharacterized protein n=1 Tax=Haemonchus placei TaxID=6290 RepID=A0A0N4W7U3_HAEPC|nr:unnamed protein product [Haemonchus placei]
MVAGCSFAIRRCATVAVTAASSSPSRPIHPVLSQMQLISIDSSKQSLLGNVQNGDVGEAEKRAGLTQGHACPSPHIATPGYPEH